MRERKAELKRLALSVRRELGFKSHEPIDPRVIAAEYGFAVFTLRDAGLDEAALTRIRDDLSDRWSGAVVSDGRRAVILENEFHPLGRRNSTVAHEVAHIVLEHPLATRILDERSCGAGRVLESEADELSGELLLPRDALVPAAIQGASIAQIAEHFSVSEQFATWRYNMSGVRNILKARKQSRNAR